MNNSWTVLVPAVYERFLPDHIDDFSTYRTYPSEVSTGDLCRRISECDAFVHRTVALTEEVLSNAPNLQIIVKAGIGLDAINVQAASERGIIVCNTPGTNARTVAEQTLTLLLAAWKQLLPADQSVRSDGWNEHRLDRTRHEIPDIHGITLGIFGCGNIGTQTATLANGLGMDCIGYDPYISRSEMPSLITPISDKSKFFEKSEAICVHVPITDETRGTITLEDLRKVGPAGVVVNTARGGIIDESALHIALTEGAIRAAGLDVMHQEPPPTDHPLLDRTDVVFSPHIAGVSEDAYINASRQIATHLRTAYEGDLPETIVNAADLNT